MPYVPIHPGGWKNFPDTSTPIEATALTKIEQGIGTAQDDIDDHVVSSLNVHGIVNTGQLYKQNGTDVTVADGGTGASTAADARTNLGLGTIATQSAAAVAITGGSITGILLALADGGTGASDAATARTNLGAAPVASPVFTGVVTSPVYAASGLTGATQASRYGGATLATAPTTGTWAKGDYVITHTGRMFICTTAGTPGNWTEVTASLDQLQDGLGSTVPPASGGFIQVDVDLSTGVAGGQSVIGGTGAGEDLTLVSTTHATKGSVLLLDGDPTYTAAPGELLGILAARTITANYASQLQPTLIKDSSTRVMQTAGVSGGNPLIGIHFAGVFKNANAVAAHLTSNTGNLQSGWQGIWDQQTVQADGASIHVGTVRSFRAGTQFSVINAGVILGGYYSGFMTAAVNVGAGVTLTQLAHYRVSNATITGTVTDQIGMYIAALSGATNNVGIWNDNTSRLMHPVTIGADAAATWLAHIKGGNAADSGVGIDVSTVGPTAPASNASGVVSVYKGTTNYYLLITFNDGGTTRYKYMQLNGVGSTWADGTALPV